MSLPAESAPRRSPGAPDWACVRFLRRAFGAQPFGMAEIRAAAAAYYASGRAACAIRCPVSRAMHGEPPGRWSKCPLKPSGGLLSVPRNVMASTMNLNVACLS